MIESSQPYSTVTAILPGAIVPRVMNSIQQQQGASALRWKARGTLLHDHWLKRFLPPVSPAKSMLQMLVPDHNVKRVVNTVAEEGSMHRQAIGAVYSTPCEHLWVGKDYHLWPSDEKAHSQNESANLKEELSLICAVVGHQQSDKVAKAAVNAGAHGPIVYYSEGRGIRDRLGWLRITKETEKEVLMVLADEADVEQVFNAMAKAAELHLPGRGFMYRLPVTQGLFNLPGRVSNQRYTANMQQMIHAIDHLAGHTDWRDQTVFAVGGSGKGVGLNVALPNSGSEQEYVCLSAIAKRDDTQRLMDMMLDAGAPGLNLNFANFSAAQEGDVVAGAQINQDYGMLRCVVTKDLAPTICGAIRDQAEPAGITDLCLMQIAAPRVATYVPGRIDFRQTDTAA